MDKVGKKLHRAAELIAERGLAKGMYHAPDGSLCILAALAVAGGLWPSAYGETHGEDEVLQRCRIALPRECLTITRMAEWNNFKETTKEDVIMTLLIAAEAE